MWVAVACAGTEQPPGAETPATDAQCERIRVEWFGVYQELVSNTACGDDDDCHAPGVPCEPPYTGCQVAVSTSVTQGMIEDVGDGYREEAEAVGCVIESVQCDCYGGYPAKCDEGTCVLDGPYGPG